MNLADVQHKQLNSSHKQLNSSLLAATTLSLSFRRRKSFNPDASSKNQKPSSFLKRTLLDVDETRQSLSETNLVSNSLNGDIATSLLLDENESFIQRNGRQILSPIIPPGLRNNPAIRRISVSKTKISPPFIKTASYMITSSRVSFQELVICVLHCLQHLTGGRGKVLAPNDDLSVKQVCYEIAFNVLKYRAVIVDVLNESHFFASFPELHDSQQLVVILTFIQYIIEQPPPKDNVYHADVRSILRALFVHKVHIDASFARSRIKLNAATVIHLLPEEDRAEYEKSTQRDEDAPPYYVRVNKIKNCPDDVVGSLQSRFRYYSSIPEPSALVRNPGFHKDADFKDLLVFPSSLREELTGLSIVKDCSLVLQEKILSNVVNSLLGLMMRGYDIVQTHAGSGSLFTYLASVLDGNKCKLRVCGCNANDIPHLQRNVNKQGIKNVELNSTQFLCCPIREKPRVQAVVCTPPNTMSAVKEPFRYALYEGDYSVAGEKVKKQQTSLRQYISHQTKTLRQALLYPKATTVIYFTLSNNFQENEGVVRNCLEEFNEKCENPAHRFNPIPVSQSVRQQMMQTGENPPPSEFFKTVQPTAGCAGGFIVVLYRKMPEDPKPVDPEPATAITGATTTTTSTTSTSALGATNASSSTTNITSRSNASSTMNVTSRSNLNYGRDSISASTLPSVQPKRKKKGHPKVITMGLEDDCTPVTGDLTKLALVEKAPSLQAFKKDFIQSYEMVMGPGSRAKLTRMKREPRPKKEPEPILPKVSKVVTEAMKQRKREKFRSVAVYKSVIDHPHPFK